MKCETFNFSETNGSDSKVIDNIAEEIRNDYVNYLINIGREEEKNINWWVLNFVCRNTFISPLFSNICYLIMFKRKLDDGFIYDRVIVNSSAMSSVLCEFRSRYGYSFKIIYKGRNIIHKNFNRFYTYIKVIMHFFLSWVFARNTRFCKKKISINKSITLLDVFVFKNSFKNGVYKDRYYPGLLESISSSKKRYIYYVPTFYSIKNYKKIFTETRKSKQNFLLKEDYLSIRDYFSALLYPLKIRKLRIGILKFKGFNIDPLVKEEMLNDRVSNTSMYGLLNYKFVKRLKENNVKIRTVVNWFENQSIDHGFNLGFNKYYPKARLIGYQGFPLSNNYLSIYPTEQEMKNRVIPKEVYVIGKGYIDLVRKFCLNLVVKTAPAFRFRGVWERNEGYSKHREVIVLIALPILYDESANIINIVLKASKIIKLDKCLFYIKPHPTQNIKFLKYKWMRKLSPEFKFISGDFNLYIEKSDVLISCTSNTCLETIARGIPVIVIGSRIGLTQLVIPRDIKQDIWKLCYTEEEVGDAIKFYMNRGGKVINRYKRIGKEIRKKYFEPLKDSNVRNFVKLL